VLLRLLDRAPDGLRPGPRTVRRLAFASLAVLTFIVVTGVAVRLTASGLGCPTWPRCTADSFVVQREMGVHGAIEFGNRLLAFVVGLVVLATIAATLLRRPWRRDLTLLALALLGGVVAQGVLGGITVLTGLNPVTVAAHFLLSMVLLVAAVALHERTGEPDGAARLVVPPAVHRLSAVTLAVAALVLVLGTVVTGAGPHSGDPRAQRLPLDPETVAQVHADGVFLLLGLAVALPLVLRATSAPDRTRRRSAWLLGVVLAQGVVGYAQYFTGLPVLLVGLHVLGACLVWIAALRLHLALRERTGVLAPDGSAATARAVVPQRVGEPEPVPLGRG
jgi:cytochrome c oxidase assembly protein subunit 15